MKFLFSLFFLGCVIFQVKGQSASWIRLMTYNIRYNNPADGVDAWGNRKAELIRFVSNQNADIMGFQEVLVDQLKELEYGLNAEKRKYEWVGVGRDDGKFKGEFAPIFYNKDRFEKVSAGHFWLAPNSDRPELGWDAVCIRICTYVILRNRYSGETFSVFNAHLDHIGAVARKESASLMLRKMKEIFPNGKHILMGDFNADLTDTAFVGFQSWTTSRFHFRADEFTFSTFDPAVQKGPMIDHILIDNRKIRTNRPRILRPMLRNRYLSDHFPVIWEIQF